MEKLDVEISHITSKQANISLLSDAYNVKMSFATTCQTRLFKKLAINDGDKEYI